MRVNPAREFPVCSHSSSSSIRPPNADRTRSLEVLCERVDLMTPNVRACAPAGNQNQRRAIARLPASITRSDTPSPTSTFRSHYPAAECAQTTEACAVIPAMSRRIGRGNKLFTIYYLRTLLPGQLRSRRRSGASHWEKLARNKYLLRAGFCWVEVESSSIRHTPPE